MRKNPSSFIVAAPLENNLFIWHFTISGADDTEFEGGRYHGKIILPSAYPFKAPDLIMLTKSGRFEINTKICLSFTGYHHELWQPAWTVKTMLIALRAFMETKAEGVGAMSVNKEQRRRYAKLSHKFECAQCEAKMSEVCFAVDTETKQKPKGMERRKSVEVRDEEQTDETETATETESAVIARDQEALLNRNA